MTREETTAYVLATANTLGLPIAAEHLPGVIENFERLAAIAAHIDAFKLEPADEPAPVWRP